MRRRNKQNFKWVREEIWILDKEKEGNSVNREEFWYYIFFRGRGDKRRETNTGWIALQFRKRGDCVWTSSLNLAPLNCLLCSFLSSLWLTHSLWRFFFTFLRFFLKNILSLFAIPHIKCRYTVSHFFSFWAFKIHRFLFLTLCIYISIFLYFYLLLCRGNLFLKKVN